MVYERLDKGRMITLGELISAVGDRYAASEILFWYMHSSKLARKRDHPPGSDSRKEAAKARYKVNKRWGHTS